jgi:hypothetical protein
VYFSVTKTTALILCLNLDVCDVICFSARNVGVTIFAGISSMAEENSLYLPLYHSDLNPVRLFCGDIRNRVVQECRSVNLKEMQMFYKKVFAEYTKE